MNVAFIPARGGSKSIPLKNIKHICGHPLVYWTVKAACECRYIDVVYVATDSEKIRNIVENFNFQKIKVIDRSVESATDTASTEFAMLEFAEKYQFDNIVLIQATSPLLKASDLERGFEALKEKGTDSVFSVVQHKRFHWDNNKDGYAHPTNYDIFHRPRRQEFNGDFVENGAFYITSKTALLQSKNRISGNIKAVEMSEDTFFEIDEPSDWVIIEALMKKNGLGAFSPKIFLTDCDGCLTDGGMYYSEKGDELKKFNTRDGMGFALLKQKGIITGIITGENVELNRKRAEKLQLDIFESGCKDKLAEILRICKERNIDISDVCYVGDDINDIEALEAVGYSCCPADASPEVKTIVKYISKHKGGCGAVRDCIDNYILKLGKQCSQESSSQESPKNTTTESVETPFPSASLLLDCVRDEYEKERDRMQNLDNKASWLMYAILVIMTIFVPVIPFSKFQHIFTQGADWQRGIIYIFSIPLIASLVLLMLAFRRLYQTYSPKTIFRFDIKNATNPDCQVLSQNDMEIALCAHYRDAIKENIKTNNKKAEGIHVGLQLAFWGFFTLAIIAVILVICIGGA